MKRFYFLHFILGAALVFGAGYYTGSSEQLNRQAGFDSFEKSIVDPEGKLDLRRYWSVWEKVQDGYVDAEHIDEEAAVYGSIKGLVNSLGDKYSAFMTPDETALFQSSLNSELEGIGAELSEQEGQLVVVSPIKNSPAERAGIKPGDFIVAIDGVDATDYTFFDAIKNIRGEKGTEVKLTIVRAIDENSYGDPFDVTIVRDEILLDSVVTEVLDGNIYHISVNQFSDDTVSEFFKAAQDALLGGAEGLIVDLRYNGGGYLEAAVDIFGEFVPEDQTAVIVESGATKEREMYKTSGSGRLSEIPLVVLVNEGSASASEILAGAIQDFGIGTVVGTQTFGKGTVQQIDILPDGSALRLTIAKWFTPNDRTIEDVGIAPDVVVEQTEDLEEDAQLDKAISILKAN